MVRRQVIQVSRQNDVVLNHFAVTCRPRVLQSEPDLERAKPTRVLRSYIIEVQALSLEVVIRRVIRERLRQSTAAADERTSSLQWRVQPFVRIQGHGISRL